MFESNNLANASIMIEVCRDALVRGGFVDEAKVLRGLEIYDLADAGLALDALQGINIPEEGEVSDARKYAISALTSILQCVDRLAS